jgi:hypothetical protein
MKTISGPMLAPVALQFVPISSAAMFPRVAHFPDGRPTRVLEGPFSTLLRRVELPDSALTSTAYAARLRLTPHAHVGHFCRSYATAGSSSSTASQPRLG